MIIVRGRKTLDVDRGELLSQAQPYSGIAIDIGTGDGRWVIDYAREHPDWFVIGLDPVAENMAEQAGRALRKRTQVENAIFVMASVEQLPVELNGLCDRIFINLPWGSLMRALILADEDVLTNLAAIARPAAELRIVLNLRIFDDPVPLEVRDLPEIDPTYVDSQLRPAYRDAGFEIVESRMMSPEELVELSTTWSKRLSHRKPPPSVLIRATRRRCAS